MIWNNQIEQIVGTMRYYVGTYIVLVGIKHVNELLSHWTAAGLIQYTCSSVLALIMYKTVW